MRNQNQQTPKRPTRINNEFINKEKQKARAIHSRRKKMYRRLSVMGIIFFLLISTLTFNLYSKKHELAEREKEYVATQKELKKQKEEQKELNLKIKQLNDDDYIAKLARKELFLSKDGEIIFSTPNSKDAKGEKDKSNK